VDDGEDAGGAEDTVEGEDLGGKKDEDGGEKSGGAEGAGEREDSEDG
jgi:hypothetical protein